MGCASSLEPPPPPPLAGDKKAPSSAAAQQEAVAAWLDGVATGPDVDDVSGVPNGDGICASDPFSDSLFGDLASVSCAAVMHRVCGPTSLTPPSLPPYRPRPFANNNPFRERRHRTYATSLSSCETSDFASRSIPPPHDGGDSDSDVDKHAPSFAQPPN